MERSLLLAFAVTVVMVSGCGTIFTGTSDTITINSDPPEVRVYFDGQYKGKTPVTMKVSRSLMTRTESRLSVEKDGYKKQEFLLTKEFNRVTLFNLSTVTAWTTDVASGALMQYSPTEYMILLEEEKPTPSARASFDLIRFIYFNFDNVKKDIAQGRGEFMDAIVALVKPRNKYQYVKDVLGSNIYQSATTPTELITLLNRDRISYALDL